MAEIHLRNLRKQWGDFVGSDIPDLKIADKEFLVLLGPSGCGKSTTMRIIAGLEEATSGDVMFDGERANDLTPGERDIAMVFQSYGLYPNMSVYENIRFPLKVRKIDPARHDEMVRKASAMVELDEFLDRKPAALSGGQRQRVALARAIVRRPKVFLMDEPLSNLDAKLRVTMRAEMKHLSQELQVTTIYVTHDQIEAMTLADRVAIMKNGVIQQLGTPDEIYNNPENLFVAGFIGSPAMNLINGSVQDGMFVTTGGTRLVSLPGAPEMGAAILGVRADDMSIHEPGEGSIDVTIYAYENTGENTMLTVQWGNQRVIARGDRHLRKQQGETVGISLDQNHLYLFDPTTESRVRYGQ